MDPVITIVIISVLVVAVIWIIVSSLCIVPQGSTWVIERLGRYATTWEAGLHLKTPLLERVVRKISMKEQVADFEARRPTGSSRRRRQEEPILRKGI